MHDWSKEVEGAIAALNLSAAREAEVVEELNQHLNDHYDELLLAGTAEEQAYRILKQDLTDGKLVAGLKAGEMFSVVNRTNCHAISPTGSQRLHLMGQALRPATQGQILHWSLMRMLYCPLRSPFKASSRLPGTAARSLSSTAASSRSSLRQAARSIPENVLTRLPDAKSLVRLSR